MLMELLKAFMIIMVAEMGDKTQLLAMTFATKYSTKKVLVGVGIGSALNHGLAILFGTILASYIDLGKLQILGGVMFLIFGLWGLKIGDDGEEEDTKEKYGPILTVALAFFIGELGDKTQLAAMTISTYANYAALVLMGTVLGMIFTSSIGIFVGVKIGDRVPEIYIKLVSSVIFLVFGFTKLYSSLPEEYLNLKYFGVGSAIIVAIAIYMIANILSKRGKESGFIESYKETAEVLRDQDIQLRVAVESLCLGKEVCRPCEGSSCAIDFVEEVLDSEEMEQHRIDFHRSKFTREELVEAISMTLYYYFLNKDKNTENKKLEFTKSALEKALFEMTVEHGESLEDYISEVKKIDIEIGELVEKRIIGMGVI